MHMLFGMNTTLGMSVYVQDLKSCVLQVIKAPYTIKEKKVVNHVRTTRKDSREKRIALCNLQTAGDS